MGRLSVQMVPIDRLKPMPGNPRRISEAGLRKLVRSLKEFGWTNPILAQQDTGMVIAGHQRLRAAREAGITEVPVIYLDFDDAKAKAYALADNRIAEETEWDEALLEGLLREIDGQIDLSLTGFDPQEIDRLLHPLDRVREDAPGDDEAIEPGETERPVVQPGELWLLGDHRLLCADATDIANVRRLMGGEKAALFHTDPPYLVDYTGADRPDDSGKDWSGVYHEVEIHDAEAFLRRLFAGAIEACREDAAWYVWHGHRLEGLIERIWDELGVHNHQQIVWVKPVATHTYSYYPWRHEPCLMGWRKGHKPRHDGDNSHALTSVWELDWEGQPRPLRNWHPTQKPVELFAIPMRKHTLPGEIVYEPCAGSGSQIIAAEQMKRRCYAMEIEPVFCTGIIRRWQEFTGREAVREDGVSFAEAAAQRQEATADGR